MLLLPLLYFIFGTTVLCYRLRPPCNSTITINTTHPVCHKYKNSTKCNLVAKKYEKRDDKIAKIYTTKNDQIPFSYIVYVKNDTSKVDFDSHLNWVDFRSNKDLGKLRNIKEKTSYLKASSEDKIGVTDHFKIGHVLGYTGYFLDTTIEAIRKSSIVDFIERNSLLSVDTKNVSVSSPTIQYNAPWGLARISHREPLSIDTFDQYLYDSDGGKGVISYVIDTGIYIENIQFSGRARWGITIPKNTKSEDGSGHGIHVSGTIGSDLYGVAKNVELVAVKVLNRFGVGSVANIIKGLEYVVNEHKKSVAKNDPNFKGSTANLSLGGGLSNALNAAIDAASDEGIFIAKAAGNSNANACNSSPASAKKGISVGASTIAEDMASFSNFGKCVDIFAPGLNILSTYIGSNNASAYLSGTSMAAPHINGLQAYFLSLQPETTSEFSGAPVTPDQLKKRIIAFGTHDALNLIPKDTPNVLGYNGAGRDLSNFWNL
ncbi:SUB8 [Candida pseudojiufengensis]|uniref:SUB8 n=1 Tax=Candida pseudojiufengensis TaxID=497109 RepID=UPI0022248459|nr:SUB8 [Candida pseudojiufengensis]KAI5959912.1 SUB8 [Candida pseudojiufengensis]